MTLLHLPSMDKQASHEISVVRKVSKSQSMNSPHSRKDKAPSDIQMCASDGLLIWQFTFPL